MKINEVNNSKKHVAVLIIFIVTCGFMIIRWIKNDREVDRKNLNTYFAGRVKLIEYDIKQFPTITVGDSTYYIGSGYNVDHNIDLGDSIIKIKVSEVYRLIKYKTNETIEFTK